MAVARELYRIMMSGVVVWVVQEQIINGSEGGESSRQHLAFANNGFRPPTTWAFSDCREMRLPCTRRNGQRWLRYVVQGDMG